MVQSTRPEGILISDHLSTSHIQGFLTSLKRLPDLWLIPVLIICDSTPTPSPAPSKLIQEGTVRSEEGGELEDPNDRSRRLAMLELGARAVFPPDRATYPSIQATFTGAAHTRQRVEDLVNTLQGAVLHYAQHQRRLLPSTVTLEGPPPSFSPTEQAVLNLLCRGMTDAQIAYSLGCSSAAVGNAVRSLLEKLEMDLRGELIRVALDNDLVTE
ncbi:hypothetical protein NSK_003938 [Nannochloropsis salina CCMP1776]|uniref:HTH luxR-type domain-containing protein n=1 Tax=Nannochloropsis salina CCMP1776 TaxID=1027361 RepID=A0A4D9D0M4_9STRA|nr:hypothetical protein NSK_003938 [Nannochloropsis salina CCMP1776]|eukprot:TFJ84906.1 hypothetical protein NSK_003938 [Nannochloropsis salina CCMP1776]